jgi:hypothetical protein
MEVWHKLRRKQLNQPALVSLARQDLDVGGGAIHVFFDASRTGHDTANNQITNNTLSLRGSATITAGVTCYNVTDCLPYWTSKGNLFQGNTYRVPGRTGENWALSSPVDWASWRAIGFDTTGDLIVP